MQLLTSLACASLVLSTAVAQHRLVTHGKDRLAIVAADGAIEWEMPWGGIHDLHVLPNGNLMVQEGRAKVVEIDIGRKAVVWSYDSAASHAGEPVEVHAFQPLSDGRVMIAESGPARIVEIDRMGRVQHEVALKLDRPHAHTDTRLARKLSSGNYLVCHEGDGVVREYDAEGQVVWEFDVPLFGREPTGGHGPESFGDKCFAALRLESGNTLVATGNGHSVLEVTPAGEVVWQLAQNDLEGITLAWVTTLEVLPNGNYVIGNCHAGPGQPLVIEIEPKTKKVVWRFDRFDDFGNSVSNSKLLDVGPDAEVLARARALHRRAITLDTHKDISPQLASEDVPESEVPRKRFLERNDPTRWGSNQADFPKMRAGGLDVAFFIVYVGQSTLDAPGFARAKEQALAKFEAIHRMAKRFPADIEIAYTAADVERIAQAGKLVACIGIENGYAMGEDLSLVADFHERGARYMSITHNGHSQLGDSNTPAEPLHGGLTDLGRRAIEEMNLHGIMVDVSHSGKKTMLQTVAHSKAPVIASHSSVDGVYEHPRNLDDEQLDALKANGGVIQMVAFKSYVKDDDARMVALRKLRAELGVPRRRGGSPPDTPEVVEKRRLFRERAREVERQYPGAGVKEFADHIDYAVKRIGIDHVAISSDFDGGGGVEGWMDASETFNVTLELVRRGYSDEDVAKLWSKNTLRVWRAVEEVAQRLQDR
ncbi:MAG: PQQ-binding-like beta-propeller repeat protein [bacterium]|nr:PQQ-binding-like beta-propeller repeat protein [bacterium]